MVTKPRLIRKGNPPGIRVAKRVCVGTRAARGPRAGWAAAARGGQVYPWRVACRFESRSGFVALDQLRTVDSERLVTRLGRLSSATTTDVLDTLQEMFAN